MEEYYKSVFSPITEDTLSGNLSNTIAGRIYNFFNFDGGGYTVDGACSSSLIAVATAATALTNGDLGINCHVILESGDAPAAQLEPSIEERSLLVSNQDTEIIVFTAASVSALIQRISAVSSMAKGLSLCELADLAFHLTRELNPGLPIRATVIAGTPDELIERLNLLEKLLRETPPSQGEFVVSPQKEVWVGNAVL